MSDFRRAQVTRAANGHYLLEWQLVTPKSVDVYVSDRADGEYTRLLSTSANTIAVDLPAVPRQHFLLQTDTSIMAVAERRLVFDGTPNLRDFGGYRTVDGAMVTWGKLFRSGRLSALTSADQQFIEQLGIRRIFDFRRDEEVQHSPTRLHATTAAAIRRLPMGEGNHGDFTRRLRNGEFTAPEAVRFMTDLYIGLALRNGAGYREVLQHLLDGDDPLLIHCTAGKDRTGVGAALILLLLGVDRDTVMEDYLLTAAYFPAADDLHSIMRDVGENSRARAALEQLMTVKPEFLQGFFQAIDHNFRDEEHYFAEVFGIGPAERDTIRARWLR